MKAWLNTNRQHWPVMGFTVGLVLLAAVLIAGTSTVGWCGAGESGPVCFRNWFGALGNVAAAAMALVALLIVRERAAQPALPLLSHPIPPDVAAPAPVPPERVLHRLLQVGRDARDEVQDLAAAVERFSQTGIAPGGPEDFGALRRRWQGRDLAIGEAAEQARLSDPATQRAASRLRRLGDDVAAALAPLGATLDEIGRLRLQDPDGADSRAHRQRLLYLKGALDDLGPKFDAFVDECEDMSVPPAPARPRSLAAVR